MDKLDKYNAQVALMHEVANFRIAMAKLNEAMSNIYIDENDYICDKYPFDKSFDEMYFDIIEWADMVQKNIWEDIKNDWNIRE